MSFKTESFPERCIGNVSAASRASFGVAPGPAEASSVERRSATAIGGSMEERAGAAPGDAMRRFYQEMGVTSILLIEDDQWTRDSLSLFFRIEGCRLQAVSNAE